MRLRVTSAKKDEKERVRANLMRAALQLSAAHGFASLGLREVSREGGIAPTSFYRHFADMQELGLAIIREHSARVQRELGERALAAPGAPAIAELVDAAWEWLARDPELMLFTLAERHGASAAFREQLRAELALLARALHQAVSGEKPDAKSPPPFAAEAAVVLLFEGCGRALDEAPPRRGKAREPLIVALRRLLEPARPL
jgi:TetR/AcrR family transcriptional regulator, fatty acid biosynthesis regulator